MIENNKKVEEFIKNYKKHLADSWIEIDSITDSKQESLNIMGKLAIEVMCAPFVILCLEAGYKECPISLTDEMGFAVRAQVDNILSIAELEASNDTE